MALTETRRPFDGATWMLEWMLLTCGMFVWCWGLFTCTARASALTPSTIPSSQPSSRPSGDSGITGKVVIVSDHSGAKHPTTRSNPYQAWLSFKDSTGKVIARCHTDERGIFRVNLKPGAYTIIPEDHRPQPPRGVKQMVQVNPGEFSNVEVKYDSGVR